MESTPFFRSPTEFEPLLPPATSTQLTELARQVVVKSAALAWAAHPATIEVLGDLLREMNSYYSNRIEGQSTHPLDIAKALRSEYSTSQDTARLQRLAVAHIQAEQRLEGSDVADVLTMAFLCEAHRELYGHLPAADRGGSAGLVGLITPGRYRSMRVVVGRHVPPEPDAIEAFGRRFDAVYGRRHSLEGTVIAIAAAHQRISWVHPFEDGNGRAARLQSHCALFPLSQGLWSVSRGLARQRESYYAYLGAADLPRRGDLDGRGNLSEKALVEWCEWFLQCCLDQIEFMSSMLKLDDVQRRIAALVTARAAQDNRYRSETILALFHMFATGPLPRGDFLRMTGLGERTARAALSHLLDVGLVTSTSHRAPVRIAFPLDSLSFIFPNLYPEAAVGQ